MFTADHGVWCDCNFIVVKESSSTISINRSLLFRHRDHDMVTIKFAIITAA